MPGFLYAHLYFVGTLICAIPFLILYLYKKECRKGMLYVGLFCGISAFLYSHISVYDYWHPNFIWKSFPIEDFLYGFFTGGFVSECADLFIKHKFKKNNNRKRYLLLFTLIAPAIIFLGINVLKFNSIIILFIFTIIISTASIIFNHKIINLQIVSGLVALLSTTFVFQILLLIDSDFIVNNWKLENLSGIMFLGVPLEEYVFGFMLGFCFTHFYEMVVGKDVTFK